MEALEKLKGIDIKGLLMLGGIIFAGITAYNRVGDNTLTIAAHDARLSVVEARSIRLDRDLVHQTERTDRLEVVLDRLDASVGTLAIEVGKLGAVLDRLLEEDKKGS